MSIVAFKKKSVIQYGSKRSGSTPGGYWVTQGPFGPLSNPSITGYGQNGFSINGGHRNVGYIGKTYQMSKQGTPFRGVTPCWGSGGCCGTYKKSRPVFNVDEVIVLGDQYKYIKPSVLSNKGMLNKKYRWIASGQYPNYWVQPNYSGNQVESASQGVYIHNISASNDCINDVNNPDKYTNFVHKGGPTLCYTSAARFKFNDMARNGPYTKTIAQPLTSSQQTLRIQRKCANPTGALKPFPFAVNAGNSGVAGVGGISGGNSGVCSLSRPVFLTPPAWYTESNTDNVET